jgi:membrane-associated phospholipid phosphatase
MQQAVIGLMALAFALLLAGCSTLPTGRAWGADATARPGWGRVREAAANAGRDPWVWLPVAGALAFQINGLDRRTSDWAREHAPVFGSTGNAERWSDDLRAASGFLMFATLLATPGGDDSREWTANKLKGGAVEFAAIGATSITTSLLKETTGRTRPDGTDDESFLSGHASSTAVSGRLAKVNLDSIAMNDAVRRAGALGIDVTVIGTAWARVEAGAHFPSDVLAGMALGNFFAHFATEAFLDPGSTRSITFTPVDGGALLSWNARF